MPESYYDHRPPMPDDYWDEVDYKYGNALQKKLDEQEPDGDPYEQRKLDELEKECHV